MFALCRGVLLAENLNEDLKLAVLNKVLNSTTTPILPSESRQLLSLAESCILASTSSSFTENAAGLITKRIAETNLDSIGEYFNPEHYSTLLSTPNNPSILRYCCLIAKYLSSQILSNPQVIIAVQTSLDKCASKESRFEFCNFINSFPIYSFAISTSKPSIERFVSWLSEYQFDTFSSHSEFDSHVFCISKALSSITTHSEQAMWCALCIMFEIISKEQNISPALASVLLITPLNFVERVSSFVTSHTVNPKSLLIATERVLNWPLYGMLSKWSIAILRGLAITKQFSILTQAIASSVQKIFLQLLVPELSNGAMDLLEFMLLGFQHNPRLFHLIAPQIPSILSQIQRKPQNQTLEPIFLSGSILEAHSKSLKIGILKSYNLEPSNMKEEQNPLVIRFSQLIQCLIFHFPGYPDIYNNLVPIVNFTVKITEDRIIKILKENAWLTSIPDSGESEASIPITSNGKVGLINLGSTCFANATLQALHSSDSFSSLIYSFPRSAAMKTPVSSQVQRLFAFLTLSQRSAIAPNHLFQFLPKWCHNGTQQDASEFFRCLLDLIETEMKSEHISVSQKLPLSGTLINSIECSSCHKISTANEPFIDISLTLDCISETSVSTLLNSFITEPTILNDENQYFCSNCKIHVNAIKTTSIQNPAPKVLIASLSRFKFNRETGTTEKVLCPVLLEQEIQVKCQSIDRSYYLNAVVMHSGKSVICGHYYCIARKSNDSHWFMFNDSRVSPFSFDQLLNISKIFPTDVPYILLFSQLQEEKETLVIPEQLSKEVFVDNSQLLLEQEKAHSQKQSQTNYLHNNSNSRSNHDDHDEDTDDSNTHQEFQMPKFIC